MMLADVNLASAYSVGKHPARAYRCEACRDKENKRAVQINKDKAYIRGEDSERLDRD